MAVKTVTLTVEAYDALASLKQENESFSDVVCRLTGSRILLSAFAGAWIGADPAKIQRIQEHLKASDRESRAKVRRLVREAQDRGQPR